MFEMIKKHWVVQHVSSKSLNNIVFLNILVWNHWKALCVLNIWTWNHWKTLFFKHFSLKSLNSIAFLNIWTSNHWKHCVFETFEFEIIEKHCVFKHLCLTSLKSILFLNIFIMLNPHSYPLLRYFYDHNTRTAYQLIWAYSCWKTLSNSCGLKQSCPHPLLLKQSCPRNPAGVA